MAIQISYENKTDYEAKKALELYDIDQIDMVVMVAKNKRSSKSLESTINRMKQPSLFENKLHVTKPIEIIDFETCIKSGYDWSWIFGGFS